MYVIRSVKAQPSSEPVMCSAHDTAEVAFEVFEECPADALRSDFPEIRNDCLGQSLVSAAPLKTRSFRRLKWHSMLPSGV